MLDTGGWDGQEMCLAQGRQEGAHLLQVTVLWLSCFLEARPAQGAATREPSGCGARTGYLSLWRPSPVVGSGCLWKDPGSMGCSPQGFPHL